MAKPIEHFVTLGDTRTPIKAKLQQGERAVDTNGLTLTFRMIDSEGAVVTNNSINTSQASAVTFTVSSSTIVRTDHGLEVNDEVVMTTTGTLPTGLATSATYFVVSATQHAFTVSTEKGGTAVTITGSGTGTHSYRAIGHVQYDFQAADVDTAGVFLAWFVVTASGETDHFPCDQDWDSPGFRVFVKSNVHAQA